MKSFCGLICIILLFYEILADDTKEINLIVNDGLLIAPTKLGTPSKETNLIVDTATLTSWVLHSKFNEANSSSFTNTTKDLVIIENEGFIGQDQLSFSGINKTFNYEFGVATKEDYISSFVGNNDGILGLGRNYENSVDYNITNAQSILYQVRSNSLINKNVFSINYREKKLIFGKHQNFTRLNSLPFCNLKQKDILDLFWTCRLSYVINSTEIDRKNSEINEEVVFNSGSLYSTGTFKLQKVFLYYLPESCKNTTLNEAITIVCDENTIENKMYIVLNGYGLLLSDYFENITINNEPKKRMKFNFGNIPRNDLGINFFELYDVLFDLDAKQVFIDDFNQNYLDVTKETSDSDSIENKAVLILGIILVISLSIIIITLICQKNEKNTKESIDNVFSAI